VCSNKVLIVKNKRIVQVTALCLVVLTILAFLFLELHFVDDAADGVLLWNSQEAYLFVGLSRDGYHLTAIHCLVALIPAFFGVPRARDDTRSFTIVFRVTPAGVEKHVVPDVGFRAYIPNGETIYAWDGGPLSRWAGTYFEKVDPDEPRRFLLDENALFSKKDFTDANGWSVRHSLRNWPSEIELQGERVKFLTKINDWPTTRKEVSLDIQLPSGTSQTVLRAKSWPHLVSKSEYDHTFERH
jgi:hypothetical protein